MAKTVQTRQGDAPSDIVSLQEPRARFERAVWAHRRNVPDPSEAVPEMELAFHNGPSLSTSLASPQKTLRDWPPSLDRTPKPRFAGISEVPEGGIIGAHPHDCP
jgi:hypothetical protein